MDFKPTDQHFSFAGLAADMLQGGPSAVTAGRIVELISLNIEELVYSSKSKICICNFYILRWNRQAVVTVVTFNNALNIQIRIHKLKKNQSK